MDQNLTYQKARRIRGTKVTDLLADQLLYEKSFTKAVGKTISLKTQSSIKGIKEKFDPLNVAKFLTGGSKLAPALIGRMMGRDIRDIEYFTGRNRPVRIGPNTASKITPMAGQGGDIEGINEQLLKIYDFLKLSNDRDVKRKEKEQNFREEKEIESQRRHQEFIDALNKLSGKKTATPVKKQEGQGGGIFDSLFDMINKLKEKMEGWIEKLAASQLINKPLEWLKSALGAVFTGPFLLASGIAAAMGAALIGLQLFEQKKLRELGGPKAEELGAQRQTEEFLGAGDPNALGSAIMNAGQQTKGEQIQEAIRQKQNTMAALLEPEGYTVSGVDKDGRFLFENDKGKAPPKDLYDTVSAQANLMTEKGQTLTPKDVRSQLNINDSDVPMPEVPTDIYKSDYLSPEEASKPAFVGPKTGKRNKSSLMPTSSTALNTVMAENADVNLPKKPDTQAQTVVNNLIQNKSNQKQKLAALQDIPVHNDEPSFMRMIMGSTRLV
jgi:hypothetical protein